MSSGDKRMNFYQKKFFHLNQVRDNFLGYLKGMIEATRERLFPYSGLFEEVTLSADTADSFDFSLPCTGMDASGHEMSAPPDSPGTAIYNNVPFPNENGVVYSVGMRWNDNVPSGVETNVRTKAAEYALMQEVIGEVKAPDSVNLVIAPLKLKFVIDTALLCAATPVNHAGRLARVWLVNPVSHVEEVAIYEATVQFASGHNYIEVPYTITQGPLGQLEVDSNPISTVASDYLVWVEGVTVVPKSVKDLSVDSDYVYVFLGEVTGAGTGVAPTVFDWSGQVYLGRASGWSTAVIPGSPYSEGISNVQTVLDDIVGWLNGLVNRLMSDTGTHNTDGSSYVGAAGIGDSPRSLGYTGTTSVGGTVRSFLTELLGYYNDHIGGSVDQHHAADIITAIISGTPHGEIVSTVQSVLSDILGWLNGFLTVIASTTIGNDGAKQVGAQARTGIGFGLTTGTVASQLAEIQARIEMLSLRFKVSGWTCIYDVTGTNEVFVLLDSVHYDEHLMVNIVPWVALEYTYVSISGTITCPGHNYMDGEQVSLVGVCPSALDTSLTYTVRDAVPGTFKLSHYIGGAAITGGSVGFPGPGQTIGKHRVYFTIANTGKYSVKAFGETDADTVLGWRQLRLVKNGGGTFGEYAKAIVPNVQSSTQKSTVLLDWEGDLDGGADYGLLLSGIGNGATHFELKGLAVRRIG